MNCTIPTHLNTFLQQKLEVWWYSAFKLVLEFFNYFLYFMFQNFEHLSYVIPVSTGFYDVILKS